MRSTALDSSVVLFAVILHDEGVPFVDGIAWVAGVCIVLAVAPFMFLNESEEALLDQLVDVMRP
jgi:hypothetical protein